MSVDFRIIDFNYVFQSNVELTASSQDSEFPVSNLKKFFRTKIWRSTTSASAQNIVIDLKTEEEIDSFAVFFDPVLDNVYTPDATFSLQANATNEWTSPAVDVSLTLDEDNETITHFFTSNQSYRYWRFVMTDTTNPFGYLEAHKLFLGKKIALTKVPQSGLQIIHEDQSIKDRTMFGHEYVDVLPITKQLNFLTRFLDKTNHEELFKSFIRVGNVNPIFVEIDAQEEVFEKDRFVLYGKYEGPLQGAHVVRDLVDFPLRIVEAF